MTVADVRMECIRRGVDGEHICGHDLIWAYSQLKRYDFAPDFRTLGRIIKSNSDTRERKNETVLSVIVETRKHPALVPIVLNMLETLAVPVQLFHGCNNKNFIEDSELRDFIATGRITLTSLEADSLDASSYNTLLLSRQFWQRLIARQKILIFQTDSIICKNSAFSIRDFMGFDYIGSKWRRQRPVGLVLDGGNGGLSLRDWTKSYECLTRFPPEQWPAGEDGYYAFHIDLIKGRVGRDSECARFSTQEVFLEKSFGAHQINKLSETDQRAFLEYCPEATILLLKTT